MTFTTEVKTIKKIKTYKNVFTSFSSCAMRPFFFNSFSHRFPNRAGENHNAESEKQMNAEIHIAVISNEIFTSLILPSLWLLKEHSQL